MNRRDLPALMSDWHDDAAFTCPGEIPAYTELGRPVAQVGKLDWEEPTARPGLQKCTSDDSCSTSTEQLATGSHVHFQVTTLHTYV